MGLSNIKNNDSISQELETNEKLLSLLQDKIPLNGQEKYMKFNQEWITNSSKRETFIDRINDSIELDEINEISAKDYNKLKSILKLMVNEEDILKIDSFKVEELIEQDIFKNNQDILKNIDLNENLKKDIIQRDKIVKASMNKKITYLQKIGLKEEELPKEEKEINNLIFKHQTTGRGETNSIKNLLGGVAAASLFLGGRSRTAVGILTAISGGGILLGASLAGVGLASLRGKESLVNNLLGLTDKHIEKSQENNKIWDNMEISL